MLVVDLNIDNIQIAGRLSKHPCVTLIGLPRQIDCGKFSLVSGHIVFNHYIPRYGNIE